MSLYQEWMDAKAEERAAVKRRRQVEDDLTASFRVSESFEGSKTIVDGEYKLTLTGRMVRRIDADAVQVLAAEIGAEGSLGTLFRWKPEINAKAWKAADNRVTDHLLGAITTKPGRLSYKIEHIIVAI